jgi:hypothetical protein
MSKSFAGEFAPTDKAGACNQRRNSNGFGKGQVIGQQGLDFYFVQIELRIGENPDEFVNRRPGYQRNDIITPPMLS